MNNGEINLTKEPNGIKWYSSASASDEEIKQYCSSILENPTIVSIPGIGYYDKKLYTEEQLIEAFRSGIATITDTDIWKRFVSVEKYWGKTAYNVMRKMNVGDIKVFPYKKWSAARVAASKLKADFGCEFRVNKQGFQGEQGDIQVERIK